MRENVFNKKVFIKSVKDHLKANYRKTVEQASQQEADHKGDALHAEALDQFEKEGGSGLLAAAFTHGRAPFRSHGR